ncbi:uncharacterized protein LOC142587589 [Dermacentor variabilis]|uniref:uncharacterized protein LOC142587589 n=1 Tax=Dermacentor variabilis TaxID=34621 RepID=UPI003F5B62D4
MKAVLTVHLLFVAISLSRGLEDANLKHLHAMPNTSSFLEIKKFVETSEPIWTYNSTLAVSFRCKVDVMSVCTDNVIRFNRTYYIYQQKQTRALEGLFRQDRKDQMFVRMLDGWPTTAEQLVYVSEDNTCAVLEVWLPFPAPLASGQGCRPQLAPRAEPVKE